MIFEQFYLKSLGHASYLIGTDDTGEALLLDPRRDVTIYFEAARRHGLRIRYAVDTHQHNDYVSGISELRARSIELIAGSRAEIGYPARRLEDGQRLQFGELILQALHTPGHTPEHISLLLYDRSRSEEHPSTLFSGGSLLVSDVGRPDLLGDETRTHQMAAELCSSLKEKILTLPDHVEVYPTHVSGSLCGGNIGSRLSTTIGYERRLNHVLTAIAAGKSDCIDLENLPTVPPYWRRMRKLNQQGPQELGILMEPAALQTDEFARLQQNGATVLDCRSPEAFAAHIPAALNVGLDAAFPTWAGTVLKADARTLLVLESGEQLWDVCWHFLRIGLDLPIGWLAGGMYAWRTSGREVQILPQWTVHDLDRERNSNDLLILDVRQPAEVAAGRIPGAMHISGGEAPDRLGEIPRNKRIAVICGSGYRSSVIGALLQRQGFRDVVNVLGGMTAWKTARLETAD